MALLTANTIAAQAPSAVSVTPGSGSGGLATFSFLFSDPNGGAHIVSDTIDISATLSAPGACYIYYGQGQNAIYLADDSGNFHGSLVVGSPGTQQNSQCTVDAGASSVSVSGTNLTLNLALTFSPTFVGAKNIYMEVYNGLDSGWVQRGTWTVSTSSTPSVVSVAPNGQSGSAQTFAFTFYDPNGGANIVSTQIDVNATLVAAGACYFYYGRAPNVIYLADDSGNWQSPLTIGNSGTVQNSQCALNAGASSMLISGTNLTLNLALTFKPSFAGAKNIYMEVYNGIDSGWVQRGTWTVTTAPQPDFSLGISPNSASVTPGGSATYTVTATGVNGFNGTVNFAVSGLPSGATGSFSPASVFFTGSAYTTLTISTTANVQPGSFTVTGSSGSLSHTAPASLSVNQNSPPSAVSVTPSGQIGSAQTFAFTFSDPNGGAHIVSDTIDISATLSAAGACYIYYGRAQNAIYLADDSGAFSSSLVVSSPGTQQNSQCIMNAGASSVSVSGNNLTLNLALTFKPSFAGAKNIYMEVYNGLDSGWVQRGTWTVSAANNPPDFSISLSPSSRTVAPGGSTAYTLTVVPQNGFSGTVNLTAPGLPTGLTPTFGTYSITGSGSTTLTISAVACGLAGSFTVTATGSSGALAHTATASIIVQQQAGSQTVCSLQELNACVNQPAGGPITCTLATTPNAYYVGGSPANPLNTVAIGRSNTTVTAAYKGAVTIKRVSGSNVRHLMEVLNNTSNVSITNLVFDGSSYVNPSSSDAVYDNDLLIDSQASYVTVQNSNFAYGTFSAIWFYGHNVTVTGCGFYWGTNAGIIAYDQSSLSNFYISHNTFTDNAGGAIGIFIGNGGVIDSNQLYHNAFGNTLDGGGGQIFLSSGASHITVTNNIIDGQWSSHPADWSTSRSYGMEIGGASYITTSENEVRDNAVSGIEIFGVFDKPQGVPPIPYPANHITIGHDNVHDNGYHGIQLGIGYVPNELLSTAISMLNVISQNNNAQYRGNGCEIDPLDRSLSCGPLHANWSYPQRYHGLYIDFGGPGALCLQTNATLAPNRNEAIYQDGVVYTGGFVNTTVITWQSVCPTYYP